VTARTQLQPFAVPLLLATLILLCWAQAWGLPALEDDKFWWLPKAWLMATRGLTLFPFGTMPEGLLPPGMAPPPQWSGPLPDYAHPPLFFLYLGLWFKLFGGTMVVARVALLPLITLTLVGTYRLARVLLPTPAALAATLLVAASPVCLSQFGRADLDLPLMALTPWALEALLRRRRWRFIFFAALATACKEPGVLLVVPAVLGAWMGHRRRWLFSLASASAPLVILGAWALLHWRETGWALATPERLAPTLMGITQDLLTVGRFVLLEQGRVFLTLAAVWSLTRGRLPRGSQWMLWSHVAIHILFFGAINFLGGDPLRPSGSHWRYLTPAIPTLCILGINGIVAVLQHRAMQVLAMSLSLAFSLLDLHGPPRGGVERNLYQQDLARAHLALVPRLEEALATGQAIWIGSYAYLELVSPVVGVPGRALIGLHPYGQGTDPELLSPGDLVVASSHGEPLGRLSQTWQFDMVYEIGRSQAVVRLLRVSGRGQAGPAAGH